MTAVVFCGPTISASEACTHLDAEFLPPAAQGDVLSAAQKRPTAIGVVDGYFHTVPSVWHKEILWALHHGIHVFGSGSMGALRAAELSPFGMIGVGEIFEGYQSGKILCDDEVAVIHGPGELGHPALSEPMVNIRATLDKAAQEGVIPPQKAAILAQEMKATFFPDRTYQRMLRAGADLDLSADELEQLENWLQTNQVNQKKIDAIAMLRAMADLLAGPMEPFRPRFHLERTSVFDGLGA